MNAMVKKLELQIFLDRKQRGNSIPFSTNKIQTTKNMFVLFHVDFVIVILYHVFQKHRCTQIRTHCIFHCLREREKKTGKLVLDYVIA